MARFALFDRLIRELARLQHATRQSARTGLPVDEVLDLQRQGLSRRQLLQLGLVAGTAPLLACGGTTSATASARPARPPRDPGKSIAIIGGGFAGLHCAYRLQQDHGVRATVYEAQQRIGGRMFTDRETFKAQDGMHCELGAELIDTGQTTMHALAKELGLELLDYRNDDTTLDEMVTYFGGRRYASKELLTAWLPVAARIEAATRTITSELFPTYTNHAGGAALDQMTLPQFLDQIGATGVLRQLFDIGYTAEYGVDSANQSALNMLYLISTETTKIDLLGESDERFHTKTGNDSFIRELLARLPADIVKTEHVLEAVHLGSDGRYVATFRRGGTALEVKADHLVLALPFTMLRQLDVRLDLPAVKKRAIAELGYGSNCKLMVGFAERVWRATGSNGGTYTDLGYQSTLETSRMQAPTSRFGILTNFTGGQHGIAVGEISPEHQRDVFLAQLDKVFPGAQRAATGKVARFHWPSHPWVKGSYSAYRPGQYTTIRGAEGERWQNVHFCGEHTSLLDQGFMEGAAATGADVAAEIAADLGLAKGGAAAAQFERRARRFHAASQDLQTGS